MLRYLEIIWTSFKMALQEFRSNKLRTFLSLLGITFGIFCIISVLAIVSSMNLALKTELQSIAGHTVFIGKWENGGGPDYPWWKYIKRPEVKYAEMKIVQQKAPDSTNISFFMNINGDVDYGDAVMTGVNYYGITEEFPEVQPITIGYGRFFRMDEFANGANDIVMGYTIAEQLFGKADKAVGQFVKLKNAKVALIIGVIAKQGQNIFNAWDYDHSLLMPYMFMKQMTVEQFSSPTIMVKGATSMPIGELKDELRGVMRSVRKLSPTQEDNFSLNDIGNATDFFDKLTGWMNMGGWVIAGISLVVGMFGVANIMFVTVRERIGQIGLKKAIGAKKNMILSEFLLESAFLCIIGGLIGLLGVFIITFIASAIFPFRVFIPLDIIVLAISICIIVGVLAGIIPAISAARLDPVVAIRSK
ncbi:MAG TPA: ABC transporter permease [Puia sp.]|nr:ABC transporter permease [Puia sp.]